MNVILRTATILILIRCGETVSHIAATLNVSRAIVEKVVCGESYGSVCQPDDESVINNTTGDKQ